MSSFETTDPGAGTAASIPFTETSQAAPAVIEPAASKVMHWVRENPILALSGIFVSGVAVGCAISLHHHDRTLREQLIDEPLEAMREAVYSALAPVGERLGKEFAAVRSAASEVADKMQHAGRTTGHWTEKFRRMGDHLKLW